MKILIIGGTGNISSALARFLVERGEEVTLYNRGNDTITGTKCITGDRYAHDAFEKQMAEAGEFDCVVDMICYKPEDAKSVVRAFRGRVGHFIFCSTVDVFTKSQQVYPIKEDAERKPDIAFTYAYDKAECEAILEQAYYDGGFPLTVIRPAATYNNQWCPISLMGPGETFLNRVRNGKPIIVLGDGTSYWVSSHRDDVAMAFMGAIYNKNTIGKSYNVTGDEWMTWEKYYETVARVMKAPPIDFVCIPADLLAKAAPKSAEWCLLNFKFNNIFDNSAAKADLGYKYNVTWEEGVRRMVEYHDGKGDIDNCPQFPLYDEVIMAWNKLKTSMVKELEGHDR